MINLKKLNSFINAPHFKMEGIHILKSLLQKGDWLVKIDLKERPERCILFCPDKLRAKEISVFPIQGQVLPVQLSPFRPGLSPMGLYQDLKADSSSRSGAGDMVDSLHRHSPDGRNRGESQRSSIGSDIPTTVPRFHCKHGKDGTGSVSIPGISGFHGRYYQDGTEPSSSKNKKDSGGVPTDIRGGACNSPHPLQIDWQNECHKPGDPTSSSVLQEPTNGPDNGSKESRPGLRDTSQSIP